MLQKRVKFLGIIFLLLISRSFATVPERFIASVNRKKVAVGEVIYLNLTVEGNTSIPKIEISELNGFKVDYVGPSTRMSIIRGKVSTSITHVYCLLPIKEGVFTLGPFTFQYKGKKYISNSLTIEVVNKSKASSPSGGRELELEDKIFLVLKVPKRVVYLNEEFPVTVKLYVRNLGVRNIEYPTLFHEGFSIAEFSHPIKYRELLNGVYYDVIEFKANAFATQVDSLRLGPAKIKCELLFSKKKEVHSFFDDFNRFFNNSFFNDFFSLYKIFPLTLKSPPIDIVVKKFPEKNKPSNFDGAIGEFKMEVEYKPKEVKIGDPITLRIKIKGRGNFNTVKPPKISFPEEDFKVYPFQVKIEQGQKVFEYAIIPKTEKVRSLPEVIFSYFSPIEKKYKRIVMGPFPIIVHRTMKQKLPTLIEANKKRGVVTVRQHLGKDIVYIKTILGRLFRKGLFYQQSFFWVLEFLTFLCFLITFSIHLHLTRLKTDEGYATKVKAPKIAQQGLKEAQKHFIRGDIGAFYDALFRTLQLYLGVKLHISWKGITSEVVNILSMRDVSNSVVEKVRSLFFECDMARYAPLEFDKTKMEESLKKLKEVISYLEKRDL